MKLIVATGNAHKVEEIREILTGLPYEILSMKEAGIAVEAEETGETFRENALIKARSIGPLKDAVVMADDSGLSIDALGGNPGVHSSRFLGTDTPYEVKNAWVIDALKGKTGVERNAHYDCVIALVFPDGSEDFAEGRFNGRIAEKPAGTNGFGYDPIFFVPECGKTAAELSSEEKNRRSHRGKALEKARGILEKRMQEFC